MSDKQEFISAVSVAMTAELVVVLVIFIGAAIGVNVGAITLAIGEMLQ